VFGIPDQTEQDYFRMVNLVKAIRVHPGEVKNTRIAGIDLSEYGYIEIHRYVLASQTFTLFVLGLTDAGEFRLGAVDLTTRTFSIVTQFEANELKNIRKRDLGFALCFLDHFFSHERLRYVFLTYTVDPDLSDPWRATNEQTETYLKVFRMENDETFTYIQVISAKIGETDIVRATTPEAQYTYIKNPSSPDVIPFEPGIRIVPRLLLADVNHDTYMDIVLWRKTYVAKRRDAEEPPEQEEGFKGFTLDHEEILVMFFDWETITFSDPIKMPTESLNKEHLWRLLFPSDWFHFFEDWMESSSE
jgi:hypothetical protein